MPPPLRSTQWGLHPDPSPLLLPLGPLWVLDCVYSSYFCPCQLPTPNPATFCKMPTFGYFNGWLSQMCLCVEQRVLCWIIAVQLLTSRWETWRFSHATVMLSSLPMVTFLPTLSGALPGRRSFNLESLHFLCPIQLFFFALSHHTSNFDLSMNSWLLTFPLFFWFMTSPSFFFFPPTGFITSLHSIVTPLKVRMPSYLYQQIFWSTFEPEAILGLGYSNALESRLLNSKERDVKEFQIFQVLWRKQTNKCKNLLEIR